MKNENEEIYLNRTEETVFYKHLFEQIKKVQGKDVISLMLLAFSFIPGKIWKFFKRNIWVVSEYEYLARDNGYWYYKFLREKHPEIDVYYPIKFGCKDYKKIVGLGNIIRFASFKHYMLFWAANKQFTTSKNAGFPSRICEDLVQWNFHRFQYILLNHGITRGKSPIMDPAKTNYDYICTCSEIDKKIIVEDNGQNPDKVIVTGFARHDNLKTNHELSGILIMMPTWRSWLNAKYARNKEQLDCFIKDFLDSKYYSYYMTVLNNEKLIKWLESNNIKIHFYLHDNTHYFKKYYSSTSANIIFEDIETADIQQLLIEGDLLITDYSSVLYDFAYMMKPILYYQFDKDLFEKYQYKPGQLFTYENDGMGEITKEPDELVDKIIEYGSKNFIMLSKYKERVERFFTFRDSCNCERIFQHFQY